MKRIKAKSLRPGDLALGEKHKWPFGLVISVRSMPMTELDYTFCHVPKIALTILTPDDGLFAREVVAHDFYLVSR